MGSIKEGKNYLPIVSEPDLLDVQVMIIKPRPSYGSVQGIGDSKEEEVEESVPMFPSYRLLVAGIVMLSQLCSFASQGIMGASLLIMVGQNASHLVADDNSTVQPALSLSGWRYAWNSRTQTWILAVFFLGYYVVQIPAGLATHRVGGRRLAMWGSLVLAALQLAMIGVPRLGPHPVIATVFLMGIASGCIYAPLMDILGKWVPPQESSTLVNMSFSGVGVGIAFVYGMSTLTSNIEVIGGWPFNFIALGALLVLFSVLLATLVSDSPEHSRYIGAKEQRYIAHSIRSQGLGAHTKRSVPWRQIVTSRPVLAIAASQFGTDWVQYFFITLLPLYLQRKRHIDTQVVGMLTGLPWLGYPLFGFLVSRTVDWIRQKKIVSTTTIRKTVDFFGKVVPMGLLVVMVYLPEGLPLEMVWLSLLQVPSVLLLSLAGPSWLANIVDLTPTFTGFVSSVGQVLSLPGAILLPLLVQALTPNNSNEEWQHCSLVMMAIVSVSYLVYVLLGSSEPQDWQKDEEGPRSHLISS